MAPTLRRLSGRLVTPIAIALMVALLGNAGLSGASAAPDRGRDNRDERCADAARITFRALENLNATLEELVADGTLTQEQADTVAASLTDGNPDGRPGRCAGVARSIQTTIESVSDLLGLEWNVIRDRLQAGESLAEIAESSGISRDELIDAMLTGVDERLDTAEAAERLTPEERATREEAARARIERLIDRQHPSAESGSGTHSGTPEPTLDSTRL